MGGVAAAPWIVPASALGRGGAVAPSERIVAGGIGIGGRGSGDLRWMMQESDVQLVAVCDVQRGRREAVKRMVDEKYGNNDCAVYRDLREFLAERSDLDVVLIATSDRWHALASSLAMRAGKDVYCEKPGTMTIAEGQALVATARRCGRVFQTGTQRRSMPGFVFASELARTGRLGRLHTARAHLANGTARTALAHLPAEPEPPRDELDWDLWLGPAPWRPYNARYVRGGWHGQRDFHTGSIGEWGSHTISQCQMAMEADETSAVKYEYAGDDGGEGVTCTFARGIKLVLTRQGWHGSCGVRFEGDDGWVSVADGYSTPEVSSPALLREYDRILAEYAARTGRPLDHMRDFLDCVRSRRPTVAHPGVCHRTMTTCHGANLCVWLGRTLEFDPVKEEFIGDPEANALRSRAMRAPWRI